MRPHSNVVKSRAAAGYRLQTWEVQFGVWLAHEPKPSKAAQVEMAMRLANADRARNAVGSGLTLAPITLTYPQVRYLKDRPQFRELLAKINDGALEEARTIFINDLPYYVTARRVATEQALEKGDHRAVAGLTQHAVEVAVPKRDTATPLVPIQINLTPNQAAGFASYASREAWVDELDAQHRVTRRRYEDGRVERFDEQGNVVERIPAPVAGTAAGQGERV